MVYYYHNVFTLVMFSVTSNAYENTIEEFTDTEPEYISISHTNLLSNESETINISTKDMG